MADFINVTTLNRLAKNVLAQCEPLSNVVVCGEISGFTRHYKSGHLYFNLKDEASSVKSVMFRGQTRLLNFEPQNGMQVLAYGHATIYERDGAFQLYVDYMRPFGAGAAQMAFDALYKKLEGEGLFAQERKRPLPSMPHCIGVVTSKTGAAWQDVQNVIGRRWPLVRLLLAPVTVQGLEAEQSIISGIRALDRDERPDVILVTRGGGSKEDLWIFNSERIARAAAACRKPVVSAVGHEIDTTILDYVADLRAPTPSAAAELCVPDRAEFLQKISVLQENIQNNIQNRMQICYNKFMMVGVRQSMLQVQQGLVRRRQALGQAIQNMEGAQSQKVSQAERSLQAAAALAHSLNPYAVLARGYAIASREGEVRAVEELNPGDKITVHGARAEADCTVRSVRKIMQGSGNP